MTQCGDQHQLTRGLDDIGRGAVALSAPALRQAQLAVGAPHPMDDENDLRGRIVDIGTTSWMRVRTMRFLRRASVVGASQTVYRNVFSHVPSTRVREVSHMLKAIHAQESRAAADEKARTVIADLRASRMAKAADLVEQAVHETLTYYAFPDIHWRKIRTNNPLERNRSTILLSDDEPYTKRVFVFVRHHVFALERDRKCYSCADSFFLFPDVKAIIF